MAQVTFDGNYQSIRELLDLVNLDRNAYYLRVPPYQYEPNSIKLWTAMGKLFKAIKTNKFSLDSDYFSQITKSLKPSQGVLIIEFRGGTETYFLEIGDSLVREENKLSVKKVNDES